MILPSKYVSPERALFTTSSFMFSLLQEPLPVSALWEQAKKEHRRSYPLSYVEFVLSLDLLFMLGYIELEGLHLKRK